MYEHISNALNISASNCAPNNSEYIKSQPKIQYSIVFTSPKLDTAHISIIGRLAKYIKIYLQNEELYVYESSALPAIT